MFKKDRKYYADYLSMVIKYCQDKGLDYDVTLLPERSLGYTYSIVIKDIGLYHNFWIRFHIL